MPKSKPMKKSGLLVSPNSQTLVPAQNTDEMAKMESATVAYLDNLSVEEIQEESDWGWLGGLSLSQLED
ncbi:MAG: hypothetical protein WCA00_12780 [Candidatus Acidiferrales bacterium]